METSLIYIGLILTIAVVIYISITLAWFVIQKIKYKDSFAKLMIIIGVIKWYDLPHIHHPLIHLRILIEEKIKRNNRGDKR